MYQHMQGVETEMGAHPLGTYSPLPGMATDTVGTHPTEMHSFETFCQ